MDCRSCGVVNAPGRRYCRECGARLGQPCPVCHFFNGIEDKHCGGCGRRLRSGVDSDIETGAPAAAFPGDSPLPPLGERMPPDAPSEAGTADQNVSQSEIDGLFENILDDETTDSREGDE